MLLRATGLSLMVVLAACSSPGDSTSAPTSSPASSDPRPFEWRRLSPVPSPRTEVAAAVDGDGLIVVAGGFAEPGDTVATVEIYDPRADRWAGGPALPVALNHAMAASFGGTVHVFGGYTASGAASNQAFALRGGAWQPLPLMPEGRAAGGAATAAGRIYVAGGVGPSGLATSTMVFDPGPATWSTAPGLLRAREHLSVASFGDRVYVLGGRTGTGNLADAEVFDPSAGTWRALPHMPTARGGLAGAAVSSGFVVVPGGEQLGAGGSTYPQVEALDIEAERWVTLPSMPTPRHGLGVVAIGETIYTLAGGPTPGFSFSGAVEAIDLSGLDSLACRRKSPTVVGSPSRDSLAGTRRRDVILALGGNDVVAGEEGSDVLCGGADDDRLAGGPGRDRLVGGPGRDRCVEPGRKRTHGCER